MRKRNSVRLYITNTKLKSRLLLLFKHLGVVFFIPTIRRRKQLGSTPSAGTKQKNHPFWVAFFSLVERMYPNKNSFVWLGGFGVTTLV